MTDQDQDTELKRNITDRETWLRFVFMIVFGVAFYFAATLALMAALFQFLAKLFGGEPNQGMREFGDGLGAYLQQVTKYMTFASDEKPFPFTPWPRNANPAALTENQSANH